MKSFAARCTVLLSVALLLSCDGPLDVARRATADGLDDVGVIIVDDVDPASVGEGPNGERARCLSNTGRVEWELTGLNSLVEICARQGVALDRERSRIYLYEMANFRVLALDPRGRALFTVDRVRPSALAVDEGTGDLWCVSRPPMHSVEEYGTFVYGSDGRFLSKHPWHGYSIAYNGHDDTFWIGDYDIVKVSRGGAELWRGLRTYLKWAQIRVDHRDGSIWAALRDSDLRLVRLSAEGEVLWDVQVKEGVLLDCDPRSGMAWVATRNGSIARVSPDGALLPPIAIAARLISFSRQTGMAWVATRDKILTLDSSGAVTSESPLESSDGRFVWSAAP